MVFSLALRFIPVTAEELGRVHDAQQVARRAVCRRVGLWRRLRAWQTVLVPLFVGLFRRADALARGHGRPLLRRRAASHPPGTTAALRVRSLAVLAAGLALCAAVAAAL